jgi:hypothetical protein
VSLNGFQEEKSGVERIAVARIPVPLQARSFETEVSQDDVRSGRLLKLSYSLH